MFSFGEIALTGLISLFVLGPERLPRVALTLGRYWKRVNGYLEKVRAEINQAIEIEELKELSTNALKIDRTEEMNRALGIDITGNAKEIVTPKIKAETANPTKESMVEKCQMAESGVIESSQ